MKPQVPGDAVTLGNTTRTCFGLHVCLPLLASTSPGLRVGVWEGDAGGGVRLCSSGKCEGRAAASFRWGWTSTACTSACGDAPGSTEDKAQPPRRQSCRLRLDPPWHPAPRVWVPCHTATPQLPREHTQAAGRAVLQMLQLFRGFIPTQNTSAWESATHQNTALPQAPVRARCHCQHLRAAGGSGSHTQRLTWGR